MAFLDDHATNLDKIKIYISEEDRQSAANYIIRKCGDESPMFIAMLSLEDKVAA